MHEALGCSVYSSSLILFRLDSFDVMWPILDITITLNRVGQLLEDRYYFGRPKHILLANMTLLEVRGKEWCFGVGNRISSGSGLAL